MTTTTTKAAGSMVSPFGRVSFPHLIRPRQPDGNGKARYEVALVFFPAEMDEDQKAQLQRMVEAASDLCKEQFKCGLKDGVVKNPFTKTDLKPQYYPPGGIVVRFMTYTKPGVVGPDKRPIDMEDPMGVYPGCWARVSYAPRFYNQNGNKGIGFWFRNLQKQKDGERWGGSYSSPDDDFGDINPVDSANDIAF